jgi:hypothetical protein
MTMAALLVELAKPHPDGGGKVFADGAEMGEVAAGVLVFAIIAVLVIRAIRSGMNVEVFARELRANPPRAGVATVTLSCRRSAPCCAAILSIVGPGLAPVVSARRGARGWSSRPE